MGTAHGTISGWMSQPVVMIDASATVAEAQEQVDMRDVHHMIVMENGRLRGVVCSCDLNRGAANATVARVMSSPPIVVLESVDADRAALLLTEAGVGCLPVVAAGRVVGIITRSDLVRAGALEPIEPSRCTCCGSCHHLRVEPDGLVLCTRCRDQAHTHGNEEIADVGAAD